MSNPMFKAGAKVKILATVVDYDGDDYTYKIDLVGDGEKYTWVRQDNLETAVVNARTSLLLQKKKAELELLQEEISKLEGLVESNVEGS